MEPVMQPGGQLGSERLNTGPVPPQQPVQPNLQPDSIQPDQKPGLQLKKPWYVRWWVWLLAFLGLVFVVGIACGAFWFFTLAKMPEVIGLSPEQASQRIQESSENWNIVIKDVYENPYDDKYEVLDFVVIGADPEVGTVLGKLDSSVTITLTIDLSPESLADIREIAIQDEIQDSLANGWASEDYYDEGSFIVFKAVDSDPSTDIHSTSQEFAEYNKSLYQSLAEVTRANIIATAFTADGFLYAVSFSPYSRTTEEDARLAANWLSQLLSEADEFAAQHLETIADIFVATDLGTWPGSEWSYDGETLTFFAYSPYVDTRLGDDDGNEFTAKGLLEAKSAKEQQVKTFAQIFQCNVVIGFYDKGATEPFLSISSEKLPWL